MLSSTSPNTDMSCWTGTLSCWLQLLTGLMKELPALQSPLSPCSGLSNLSWYSSGCSWLCHWCPHEPAAVGNSGLYEGKQLTSLESTQVPPSIPRGRVTHCHLFSAAQVVTQGADGAALLSSSNNPDLTGLSSSLSRAVKWFCEGTSASRESLFLLQVLVCSNFHSSALLPPSLWVCW